MADDVDAKTLDESTLLEMYGKMVLSRTLDERIWMLNRQGKAAIVASSQGHEAAQIGSVYALRRGTDQFYIYYRDLAVMLTLGMTPLEIMLGFTAKVGEPLSGARQFPTHGAYPELGLINLSNVIATQLPQAVGAALALRMRREDAIVIAYFGDGRIELRRHARGDELRGNTPLARDIHVREQQVRDIGAAASPDGCGQRGEPRGGLWDARHFD